MIQVVNNPSKAITITARQFWQLRRQHSQTAQTAVFCTDVCTGLQPCYAQDETPSGHLFSLAFGRFDSAFDGCINTTNTQIH